MATRYVATCDIVVKGVPFKAGDALAEVSLGNLAAMLRMGQATEVIENEPDAPPSAETGTETPAAPVSKPKAAKKK